ncbi:cereblon family protein [Pseudodesulfovibrio sediminis]|uniref:CULT domain-containing protein n=1 Tax=Pseudodesulfovibrio sediminis TaxID=2810563 RepID=A0ABN6EU48_9BACT|nr:cereblon family protein [Pseudodesulfovibrio sediminis]BCS88967.1 hypothetical protein PSDVSF_22090 [Pseudodesulfovibrio sediminis]
MINGNWQPTHLLRDAPPDMGVVLKDASESKSTPELEAGDGGRALVCRQCRNKITRKDLAMTVNGSHRHVYFNPMGHLFELGCFASARHLSVHGVRTEEFTWFPGYAWQVVVCSTCGSQLGWKFTGKDDGFYGLLLNMLMEEDEDRSS